MGWWGWGVLPSILSRPQQGADNSTADTALCVLSVPCCRWEWWNLWFEVALLLALFITCFLEQAFKRGRICFLAFFVLATQGCMWSAHNFLTQLELAAGGLSVRDLGQDAINAGAYCWTASNIAVVCRSSLPGLLQHTSQVAAIRCRLPLGMLDLSTCHALEGRITAVVQHIKCKDTTMLQLCAPLLLLNPLTWPRLLLTALSADVACMSCVLLLLQVLLGLCCFHW
jgi:hypothetical protein